MLGIVESLNGILLFLLRSSTTLGFSRHHFHGALRERFTNRRDVVNDGGAGSASGKDEVIIRRQKQMQQQQ